MDNNESRLKVVASFYPLYDFAQNVGGERADVSTLIPMGVEPHEFEPTASDIRSLAEADVFIYNGAGMEPWAARTVAGAGNSGLMVIDTSKGIELLEASGEHGHEEEGGEEEEHGHEAEGHHHEGGVDPHFWLDPNLVKIQVANIRDAFIAADPEGRDEYQKNAAAYIAKLDALDSRIRLAMANCSKTDILITHATLRYFCHEYGCNQIAISGIDPEAEPSPSDLASIINQARARNISAVFFESMIDPRSAQTISEEINGAALTFNSVHGLTKEEIESGEDYISLMDANIENIKKGLDCR